MKSGRVVGGASTPARIDPRPEKVGGVAQPVFNASGVRPTMGGAAQNIIVINDGDLVSNGGITS